MTTAADHANTVREALPQPGKSRWQAAYDALDALQTMAETAEDNDEEIARLEGALDTAHKDYDEMKAERDAAVQAAEAERALQETIINGYAHRVGELEAERDRARDALRQIAEENTRRDGPAAAIARAALGDKP